MPHTALALSWGKGSPSQQPFSQQLDSPHQEDAIHQALGAVSQELQRFSDVHWMAPVSSSVEEVGTCTGGGSFPESHSRYLFGL